MGHWAAKGVLCECIDDGTWVSYADPDMTIGGPKKGDRLIISKVGVSGRLVIIGFKQYGDGKWGFDATSFRPLSDFDSDMALFTHLLTQNSIQVSEDA